MKTYDAPVLRFRKRDLFFQFSFFIGHEKHSLTGVFEHEIPILGDQKLCCVHLRKRCLEVDMLRHAISRIDTVQRIRQRTGRYIFLFT